MPFESVNPTSWAAVEPASLMWYPDMLIVFHSGTFSEQNAKISVIIRHDGSGGKIYVPLAMYSFSISS